MGKNLLRGISAAVAASSCFAAGIWGASVSGASAPSRKSQFAVVDSAIRCYRLRSNPEVTYCHWVSIDAQPGGGNAPGNVVTGNVDTFSGTKNTPGNIATGNVLDTRLGFMPGNAANENTPGNSNGAGQSGDIAGYTTR